MFSVHIQLNNASIVHAVVKHLRSHTALSLLIILPFLLLLQNAYNSDFQRLALHGTLNFSKEKYNKLALEKAGIFYASRETCKDIYSLRNRRRDGGGVREVLFVEREQ